MYTHTPSLSDLPSPPTPALPLSAVSGADSLVMAAGSGHPQPPPDL